ncbi:MAG: YdcF family protein [Candidatus Eisenbacteria bacterium]|uniref:YdcF family protein n=1 Tax=Eiseniibacteriota bacterium TaxID=2212470 RepID=A0A956RP19_UNCEI|nr:YdcF family protein [Candidatus Eisenbacteria bacterium]
MGRKTRKAWIWILTILGALVLLRLLASPMLNAYANWLIVEDPFEHTDATITLSGAEGERLAAAIQLFRADKTDRLVIVGPDAPFLKVYSGEDSLSQGEAKRRIAVKKGVPDSLVTLVLGAQSTHDEATTAIAAARENGWTSLTVVTSPLHTRRARATFRKVFEGSGISIAVYHLPIERSSQNPDHWWHRENDTMAVLTESIKIGFYAYRYGIWPWS